MDETLPDLKSNTEGFTPDEKRGVSRYALRHPEALKMVESKIEFTEKSLEVMVFPRGIGPSWLMNQFSLMRSREPKIKGVVENIKVNNLGPKISDNLASITLDVTQLFPRFVTEGTKFTFAFRETDGLPGACGQAWEYQNRIGFVIYDSVLHPPDAELFEKVMIHELVHRGSRFLATHNPNKYREIVQSYCSLFRKEARLVTESEAASAVGELESQFLSRFGLEASIDEAITDAVAYAMYYKKYGSLPKQTSLLYKVRFEDNLGDILKLSDYFMGALNEI